MTVRAYRVPGRIEFLGKHTDYAGGRSLVCATEQGLRLTARRRRDPVLLIADESAGLSAELPLTAGLEIPRGHWSAYPATVARRLARDFGALEAGLTLTFTSDLPQDAGLSSSSALVVGVALAVADANDLASRSSWRAALPDREALAGYLGAVENGRAFGPFAADGGVGTMGGSQDQTAILCSRPGSLVQYGFDPVRFEGEVPFLAGYVLAVAVSGVVAAKTREALELYNGLSRAAVELRDLWNARSARTDHSLFAAITGSVDAIPRLKEYLRGHEREARLSARLDQFAAECLEIIPSVGNALERGDLGELGVLIDRSQHGAERGLGNHVPETIQLQRSARRLGAVAASAFGAGFGGSVWAMVREEVSARFLSRWAEAYVAEFPAREGAARFCTTHPGPPAGSSDVT